MQARGAVIGGMPEGAVASKKWSGSSYSAVDGCMVTVRVSSASQTRPEEQSCSMAGLFWLGTCIPLTHAAS